MTIPEILDRVGDIEQSLGDSEICHSKEDKLREDFIKYVASLNSPLAEKAKIVLMTNEFKFDRWCS